MDEGKKKRKRCTHTTNSGKKCKNKCPEGCDSCVIHKHTPPYKNSDTCPICLCGINNKSRYILSCGHEFHKRCIEISREKDPMLLLKCPTCRMEPFVIEQLKYYSKTFDLLNQLSHGNGKKYNDRYVVLFSAVNKYISKHIVTIRTNEQDKILSSDILEKLNSKMNEYIGHMISITQHGHILFSGVNNNNIGNNNIRNNIGNAARRLFNDRFSDLEDVS